MSKINTVIDSSADGVVQNLRPTKQCVAFSEGDKLPLDLLNQLDMTLVAHHNVQIFFRGKMDFCLGSLF